MAIFMSKGGACNKQFSFYNLSSRPCPSTTSLAEPWQVSMADWTTLFNHLFSPSLVPSGNHQLNNTPNNR